MHRGVHQATVIALPKAQVERLQPFEPLGDILLRVLADLPPLASSRKGAEGSCVVVDDPSAFARRVDGNRRAGVASGELDWRTRTSLGRKG